MLHNSERDFIKRHIGTSEEDQKKILQQIGYNSLEDLIKDTVPEKILLKDKLSIGEPNSEYEALRKLKNISKKNQIYSNFIGMGYYGTYTPHVILRNILENPGWYTSYTPYQAEVAQGRLEMLLNFQQMIIDFTGMDIANASLLDEGTAAAEAMSLSHRINKKDSKVIFVSNNCHPQTIEVIKTRSEPMGLKVVLGEEDNDIDKINEDIVCGIIQYPGTLGDIKDPSESISKIHKKNGKAILICDLLSLAKLKTPAELGADIAVGTWVPIVTADALHIGRLIAAGLRCAAPGPAGVRAALTLTGLLDPGTQASALSVTGLQGTEILVRVALCPLWVGDRDAALSGAGVTSQLGDAGIGGGWADHSAGGIDHTLSR